MRVKPLLNRLKIRTHTKRTIWNKFSFSHCQFKKERKNRGMRGNIKKKKSIRALIISVSSILQCLLPPPPPKRSLPSPQRAYHRTCDPKCPFFLSTFTKIQLLFYVTKDLRTNTMKRRLLWYCGNGVRSGKSLLPGLLVRPPDPSISWIRWTPSSVIFSNTFHRSYYI